MTEIIFFDSLMEIFINIENENIKIRNKINNLSYFQ